MTFSIFIDIFHFHQIGQFIKYLLYTVFWDALLENFLNVLSAHSIPREVSDSTVERLRACDSTL